MSEASLQDHPAPALSSGDQPERKRNRRSGWDVGAPAAAVSESDSADKSNNNNSNSSNSISSSDVQYIPAVPPSNLSVADQQKLELVRQLAEQKAASLQQIYLQKQMAAGIVNPQIIQTIPVVASGAVSTNTINPSPAAIDLQKKRIDNRIYVGSLYYELTEADVRTLFSPHGTITHVDMPFDPVTKKSRGYCFIEFVTEQQANLAQQQMNGFIVCGRPIKVGKPTSTGVSGAGIPPSINPSFATSVKPNPTLNIPAANSLAIPSLSLGNSIIIKNIHPSFKLTDIIAIFSSFGNIETVSFTPSEDPNTKTALVQFENASIATIACTSMNGIEPLKLIIEQPGQPVTPSHTTSASSMISSLPLNQPQMTPQAYPPIPTVQHTQPPKLSVLLENMITPDEISDPLLEGEVREEGEKFGILTKVDITMQGDVAVIILNYSKHDDAVLAQSKLNGRPFGGRVVRATLI